jgi:MFS family permease
MARPLISPAGQQTTLSGRQSRFAALHSRNFTLLWVGLIISNAGTQMQSVAQNWLVWKLSGSPTYLGFLSAAFGVPMVLLPMIGGAAADRWDRIQILKITQTAMMLVALLLTLLTWARLVQPWHFIVLTALNAFFVAFDNPTRQSLIPELVPREHLLNATSLYSAAYTGSALFGPALAGALFKPLGPTGLFLLNTLSFGAVLLALFSMRDVSSHPPIAPAPLDERLFGGLRYARRSPLVITLLTLAFMASIFGRSYSTIAAVFADRVWHAGPHGFGYLQSAAGGGALLGAFGLAASGDLRRKDRLLLIGFSLFCAGLFLFAWCPWFAAALALQVLIGMSNTLYQANIATMLQLRVPGALRGRVMSLYAIAVVGCSSLGGLVIAPLATAFGVRAAVTIGATVVAATGLLLARPLIAAAREPASTGLTEASERNRKTM